MSVARLFRHAPVVEAFRFGHDHPPAWMSHSHGVVHEWNGDNGWVCVCRRDGSTLKAYKGDWIVRDREGRVHDVVPDSVFRQDYAEVTE